MSFNYNIEKFSKKELMEMFELPEDYDESLYSLKESQLKDNICNNPTIDKETQEKTLNFLVQARQVLIGPKSDSIKEKINRFFHNNLDLKPTAIESSQEHMVQERANNPYLSSYPSHYFPGVINPLKKKITYLNINIDSKFRDNYYSSSSSNFMVNILMKTSNILTMRLSSIELPKTFYSISKQFESNYFAVTLTDTNQTEIISIPDGNYTGQGLINVINNELSKLSGDFANIVFLVNNTSTNGSGQTMVGCAPTTSFNFELNFQLDRFGNNANQIPLPLKLGWILGFRNGKYINNQNYVSESILNTSTINYIYLVIDDYNNNVKNNFYSVFNSSLLNKNILARISLQTNTYDILLQNNLNIVTTPREYFGPVSLNNLNVQLLDPYGRILDLNNMDFSFCLTLTQEYDI